MDVILHPLATISMTGHHAKVTVRLHKVIIANYYCGRIVQIGVGKCFFTRNCNQSQLLCGDNESDGRE